MCATVDKIMKRKLMMMEQGKTILAICTLTFYGWKHIYSITMIILFKTYFRGCSSFSTFLFFLPILLTDPAFTNDDITLKQNKNFGK